MGIFGRKPEGKYTCEMHPEVRMDNLGKCPKCNMKLVQSKDADKKNVSDNGRRGGCCCG